MDDCNLGDIYVSLKKLETEREAQAAQVSVDWFGFVDFHENAKVKVVHRDRVTGSLTNELEERRGTCDLCLHETRGYSNGTLHIRRDYATTKGLCIGRYV